MKRKSLLVALLVMAIAAGGILGLSQNKAEAAAKTSPKYRTVGYAFRGMFWNRSGQDLPSLTYDFALRIQNPDQNYSKFIDHVVITNAYTGEQVAVFNASNTQGLENNELPCELKPLQLFDQDLNQWQLPPDINHYQALTIEVFWKGEGEPLVGWITEVMMPIMQDEGGNWKIYPDIDLMRMETERAMQNYSITTR